MRLKRNFDPFEAITERWLYLEFGPELGAGETIVSAICSLMVVQGTDPSPNDHILSQPAIVGTQAGAFVGGLLPGVTYSFRVVATTSAGNVLPNNTRVRCQAASDR